jgi:hypothetical protein
VRKILSAAMAAALLAGGEAYEVQETRIFAAVARHFAALAAGRGICVDLHALPLSRNAVREVREQVARARKSGEPGFRRIASALRRPGISADLPTRLIDASKMIAAGPFPAVPEAERCPPVSRMTVDRAIVAGRAALVGVSLRGPCTLLGYVIALRRQKQGWRVEGSHMSYAISPPPGCGDVYREPEVTGRYLVVAG